MGWNHQPVMEKQDFLLNSSCAWKQSWLAKIFIFMILTDPLMFFLWSFFQQFSCWSFPSAFGNPQTWTCNSSFVVWWMGSSWGPLAVFNFTFSNIEHKEKYEKWSSGRMRFWRLSASSTMMRPVRSPLKIWNASQRSSDALDGWGVSKHPEGSWDDGWFLAFQPLLRRC